MSDKFALSIIHFFYHKPEHFTLCSFLFILFNHHFLFRGADVN